MKTNILLSGLLAIVLSACQYPAYLPPPEMVDVHPYGSHIAIHHKPNRSMEGELIALDSSRMIILDDASNRCLSVPMEDIYSFKIWYATSSGYEWTIPFFIVLPFINGWYSILTMPMHLITTIAVSVDARHAFVYHDRDMDFVKYRMFARFPQGVPDKLDLADIHR
ncbi:MAG: hypothetical protein M5R41_18780 [Bacteroidia bacterium]|nr:hypothetical protein [Bacteroidia bacterium]